MTYSIRIGLVAHDEKKNALIEWAKTHNSFLEKCRIVATGTTGTRLQNACPTLSIKPLKSGPLGGDQQLGALIAVGRLDALIFFVDPLSPHPHDVDVKALLRVATLTNTPLACNERTASLIIKSMAQEPQERSYSPL